MTVQYTVTILGEFELTNNVDWTEEDIEEMIMEEFPHMIPTDIEFEVLPTRSGM